MSLTPAMTEPWSETEYAVLPLAGLIVHAPTPVVKRILVQLRTFAETASQTRGSNVPPMLGCPPLQLAPDSHQSRTPPPTKAELAGLFRKRAPRPMKPIASGYH